MEEWRPIDEFNWYEISSYGRVQNTKSGRIMALSENQKGLVIVGLFHRGVQYKRSVPTLVAKSFLPRPRLESFNSIINKDGDRRNNHATNLEWRPQWFAYKYHRQFIFQRNSPIIPIAEIHTGEEFESVWDAAVKYGLLVTDILESINHQTHVWPTTQKFWRLD